MDSSYKPSVDEAEPTTNAYEDSLEGQLQYRADLSLYYAEQAKNAKTAFKRDYFKKKQTKNNQKMWNMLVRTPNQYNPLLKYLGVNTDGPTQIAANVEAGDEEISRVGYMRIEGEDVPAYDAVLTTTGDV